MIKQILSFWKKEQVSIKQVFELIEDEDGEKVFNGRNHAFQINRYN